MAVSISTWQSEMATCSGNSTQTWTLNAPSGTILSVGVQTNNIQDDFVLTQLFVYANGANAYVQVTNNQFGEIGWWAWLTLLTQDGGSEEIKITGDVESAVPKQK